MRNIYAGSFAAAALVTGATLAAPLARAQHTAPATAVSVSKQPLKTAKTPLKPQQQMAKANRPAPQSMRYLISESP